MCVGQKYGKLTVIEKIGNDNGKTIVRCKCDCGNEKVTKITYLKSGHTRSCGCLYKVAEDMTGRRFGRLTVIERSGYVLDKSNRKSINWKCQCDCGNITYVTSNNLKGKTRSCGCYLREIAGKQTITHGFRKTRLYSIYNSMKQRCNNKNNHAYKNYGGRGIKVCDEWNKPDGLKNFAEWALNNGYSDDLTIDRINVNGDYEPSNCRWVSISEQSKNTRRNVLICYEGKTMILSDFSRITGIDHRYISRFLKKGVSIEEIINNWEKKVGVKCLEK